MKLRYNNDVGNVNAYKCKLCYENLKTSRYSPIFNSHVVSHNKQATFLVYLTFWWKRTALLKPLNKIFLRILINEQKLITVTKTGEEHENQ